MESSNGGGGMRESIKTGTLHKKGTPFSLWNLTIKRCDAGMSISPIK